MVSDIVLQVCLFLLVGIMFLAMHDIPRKLFSKIRYRNRATYQAKQHFVQGAQLFDRARSTKRRSAAAATTTTTSTSLAEAAIAEADKAISLDPKDAAPHILKALTLDFQGYKTSALDSIDVALSPLAVKSLSDQEKADALTKRAELKLALSRPDRVDSALADLVSVASLSKDNAKAFCLLGECYEKKGLTEEAKKAYEEAVKVEPKLKVARDALSRLGV